MLDPLLVADTPDVAGLLARLEALEAQAVIDRADIAGLHRALDSARRIGAAIGIVMFSLKVSEGAAFDLLRHASQNGNRKLRDVADDVLATGVIPGPAQG